MSRAVWPRLKSRTIFARRAECRPAGRHASGAGPVRARPLYYFGRRPPLEAPGLKNTLSVQPEGGAGAVVKIPRFDLTRSVAPDMRLVRVAAAVVLISTAGVEPQLGRVKPHLHKLFSRPSGAPACGDERPYIMRIAVSTQQGRRGRPHGRYSGRGSRRFACWASSSPSIRLVQATLGHSGTSPTGRYLHAPTSHRRPTSAREGRPEVAVGSLTGALYRKQLVCFVPCGGGGPLTGPLRRSAP